MLMMAVLFQRGEQGARLLAADPGRQGGARLAVRHKPAACGTDQVRSHSLYYYIFTTFNKLVL